MKKTFLIGEFSKLVSVPVRTLHYYDQIDLLKAQHNQNGYRCYRSDDILTLNRILALKKLGFSLKEMKEILYSLTFEEQLQLLQKQKLIIQKELFKLQESLNLIDTWTSFSDKSKHTPEIMIKKIPNQLVYYQRYEGKSDFGLRFNKLYQAIEQSPYHMTGVMMAIYHDYWWEYDQNNADIEVCARVVGEEQEGNTRFIDDFLAVTALHCGSYETMNQTYQGMLDWCEENNVSYAGKGAIEEYIIDIVSTDNPDEFVTQLYLPIHFIK